MHPGSCRWWLVPGVILTLGYALAADFDPITTDEQILRNVKLKSDGPALLAYFRQRTPTNANRSRIDHLIR